MVRPVTELEKRIAIWEDVLGVTDLGMTSNFWDVGGDSLKAMRLITRMKKASSTSASRKPSNTRRSLHRGRILRKGEGNAEEAGIVALTDVERPEADGLCLPYACGNPPCTGSSAGCCPHRTPCSPRTCPDTARPGSPCAPSPKWRPCAWSSLRPSTTARRCSLLGYSFGGFLAHEIARRLEERDAPSPGMLVASPPPGVIGGLQAIIDSRRTRSCASRRSVYHYDFAEMTEAERRDYLNTLRWTRRRCLISLSGPPWKPHAEPRRHA